MSHCGEGTQNAGDMLAATAASVMTVAASATLGKGRRDGKDRDSVP